MATFPETLYPPEAIPADPAPVSPSRPVTPERVPLVVEALRTIVPLEGLTDAEYTWLATHGEEQHAEPGTVIFREGEPADKLNFILEGEIHVRRINSGPLALFIGRSGQMTGKLPFSRMKGYGGHSTAVGEVWGLNVHESLFPAMLQAIPSMAQRSVNVLLDRVREVTRMEQQAEKLSALGKLAANLAHELNNPASAAQRSAATLLGELRQYGDHRYELGALCVGPEFAGKLREWVEKSRARMAAYLTEVQPEERSPLAQADREETIYKWLSAHHVEDAWKIAPTLAETNVPLSDLQGFAADFPEEVIAPAFRSFASALRVARITETIVASTDRIFDLISAIKDYSYMDQTPIQDIDIAQSLDNTLAMFGSRMGGIVVETDYDPKLPPISAYGSELNQVWTALLENAIDAMPEGGRLTLHTQLAGRMAFVEISDTGPGIPQAIQSRIFEPFFTTKAPGSGLGLGLDTAKRIVGRHSGFLTVESAPGHTCFQVRLPLEQAEAY